MASRCANSVSFIFLTLLWSLVFRGSPRYKALTKPSSIQAVDCLDARTFGAVPIIRGSGGDGSGTAWEINTKAVQECLDQAVVADLSCCRVTGGDIYVSDVYVRSHTTFVVDETARLINVFNRTMVALVHIRNATNVTLAGGGTLYGNAEHYIAYYDPRYNRFEPVELNRERPRILLIDESSNILIRDISVENSTFWTIHIRNSDDVTVDHVHVYGDRRFPNNDGIDPDSSTRVTISNCHIDVADDGVCPKTWDPDRPLRYLRVVNTTIRSRSHAIKFGSHTNSDMTDAVFENVTIYDSNSGLSIQQRGPGNIDSVSFRDIRIETRYDNPRWWGNGEWLTVTSEPRDSFSLDVGHISNLIFDRIQVVSENGGLLSGRHKAIENVTMTNIEMTLRAFSNYSDGSGPRCSYLVGRDAAVPVACMGTLDYRPSLIQGDDPFCITRGGCRTLSRAHGIYLEGVREATLRNWTIVFEQSLQWFGECVVPSLDVSLNMVGITCVH